MRSESYLLDEAEHFADFLQERADSREAWDWMSLVYGFPFLMNSAFKEFSNSKILTLAYKICWSSVWTLCAPESLGFDSMYLLSLQRLDSVDELFDKASLSVSKA